MEEVWSIEEVDFNIMGLTMDCFLPPADLNKEDEVKFPAAVPNNTKSTTKARNATKVANPKVSTAKVIAVDDCSESLDDSGKL